MAVVSITNRHILPRLARVGISFLLGLWVVVGGIGAQAALAGDFVIHYAPVENLERVDVGLLDEAGDTIDMAAYILTDRPVIDALIAAKARGVVIRVVLDPTQKHDLARLTPLLADARMKRPGPIMHLKSYLVDGTVIRSGSANFTASGLKQQDNDLIVSSDGATVRSFTENFERMWSRAQPVSLAMPPAAPASTTRQPTSSTACMIKGNVNRKGERIYHLPGGRDYERVTMTDPKKRWFCSEHEAQEAGWRSSAN
ncbi:phosphatidylserine synthase [Siculibacillus lacustris]|uniref:Phospholipase D n=1 Tax=Siculibacillus lacustris TaxID=1549641 RepID=A0A4Q9VDL0_9HYPH|nr:phospholipase D-like domain-containing protein [Siculibacillus lacustris]TBW32602.1 phosphatidylserine synthase [Siculibacillus lacustris]